MGEVYRGWDDKLDRPVALKRIAPDAADAKESREMFRREARAVARLHHGSIVQVFELIEDQDGDWLVMELVDGKSLRELCGGKQIQPARVVEIARGICTGLTAAHEAGIVHRDLKLDNVMLTATGEVKILDFGIYKRLGPDDGASTTQTLSIDGRLVGTVTAMSPEQAAGGEIDHRSDLFSLGSLLYELLTGEPPFVGKNSHETLSRICLHKEKPVHEVVPEVSESFSRLVGMLLEKDPARRPQTAEQVQQALAEVITEMSGVMPRFDPSTWTGMIEVPAQTSAGTPSTGIPTPTEALPSGPTVRTLLLNDLVDSTKMVDALGDERAAEIFELHDRRAREILKATGGREIDKSDGFLMLFERPMDAVRFALGYHAALDEISEQEGVTVSSRVGIHVGEVVLRVNSADDVARGAKPLEVEGLAKAMAARFMTLAGARQTLISRGVYDLGKRAAVGAMDLPEGLEWVAHGRYTMKGVEEPVRVFEVGVEGDSPLTAPVDTKKVQAVVDEGGLFTGWKAKLVAAALVLGLGGLAWFFFGQGPEPIEIAVRAPEIGTMSEVAEGEIVASALRAALTRTLLNLQNVSVTAPDQVDSIEGTSSDVVRALAVDEVLTSKLDCSAILCEVTVSRILGDGGDVAWGARFSAPIETDLLGLDSATSQALRRGFPRRPARAGAANLTVRATDYTAYLRLLRRYEEEGVVGEILGPLEEIQKTSPRFLDAYLLISRATVARFMVSRDAADVEAALAAAQRAHELDPTNLLALLGLFNVGLNCGRLDVMEKGLAELENLAPGNPRVIAKRAYLLERQGKHREALQVMRQAAKLWGSFEALHELAVLEYRQGLIADARQHLEAALELNPGHFDVQTRLAQIELFNGDPRRAADLYEQLTQDSSKPGHLINLGLANLLLREYEVATMVFRQVIKAAPDSPPLLLNLADAELLQDNEEEAAALYARVLELLATDPIANSWQGLTIKAQALVHLGQIDAAVAAAREAIRSAPDNPNVAYETALVFALAGEAASAMAEVERAITGGVQPRWFTFPWFSALEDRPRFRELVTGAS